MKQDWDDMRVVLVLVREGSLAAAAKVLKVNYTTIARRISRAEAQYRTRLFDRLPQGYVPTKAALEAVQLAEAMEEAEAQFRLRLAGAETKLSGTFTITAPQLLISAHLCGVIDEFTRRHPDVELVVRASNELLNLNRREADLAIRISDRPGDTLVGLRLCAQQSGFFASVELAREIRKNPQVPIDWIGFTHWGGLSKIVNNSRTIGRIKVRFDDMGVIVDAARNGLGVARMPLFLGRWAGLEPVPLQPPQPYADIWAVAHRDLWGSAKVQAFKEVLLPHFKAHAPEFVAANPI